VERVKVPEMAQFSRVFVVPRSHFSTWNEGIHDEYPAILSWDVKFSKVAHNHPSNQLLDDIVVTNLDRTPAIMDNTLEASILVKVRGFCDVLPHETLAPAFESIQSLTTVYTRRTSDFWEARGPERQEDLPKSLTVSRSWFCYPERPSARFPPSWFTIESSWASQDK
jgi:hypothetical protein